MVRLTSFSSTFSGFEDNVDYIETYDLTQISSRRKQSIYQVVTDRFARSDLSTSAPCDTSQQVYCGGSWHGLISKLDYIQGMGFTAVWISPIVKQIDGVTKDGYE